MDFPILNIWMSPLSSLGAYRVVFFSFVFNIFDDNPISKQNSPRWDGAFAVSHLGLFCLPMSLKKDAKLMWVKVCQINIRI